MSFHRSILAVGSRVVILAAGDFPRRGTVARRLLETAGRVVCCDGAADAYRRHTGREPDAVVGDGDSLRGSFRTVIRVTDQNTNDLEKAADYCRRHRWTNPVVLGATGKREDHTIGNVFRALALGLELVTDRGRFVPVTGRVVIEARKGTAISVFAPDPRTRVRSEGLEWPLDGVKFENLYCATLNRATTDRVVLVSSRLICVYIDNGGRAR